MRKIVHLPDSSFYSELISALDFDDDTLIYNELTDEMFRFVLPIDVNQTFDNWKGNLPKYTFQDVGGVMTPSIGFGDLSGSYGNYDTDAIFGSELSSYFMLNVNVYWQKKIGGSGNDYGLAIAVDGSGNVYLNGYQSSDDYGSNDYGVIKLDSDGNLLWQKKIGGAGTDQGYAIAVDGSGNVYLNGAQASDDYGSTDYGVIKLDSSGNLLWQKKIGGISTDSGRAIAVDGDGNVYCNGQQASDSSGINDYGVIKLDTNGNILWQKKIGGYYSDNGYGIAVDGDGNVYLNGQQTSDVYGGTSDYGVIKLDTNGNLLWQKKIGGAGTDQGYAIAVDGSGNIYLNGYQYSDSYGVHDYGVIKLDSDGNILWQKKIGGINSDIGYAVAVDGSGNVYLNGYQSSDSYGSFDYGVIKLDTNGNLLWQKKIGGSSHDYGWAIAVDGSGNVYLNGQQESDSYGVSDYGVMKLYTDQESDINLSIGDMSLSTGNMNLSIGTMSLSIGNMSLSIGDMNLSIGDIDMSGEVGGGLVYLG